MRVSVRVEPPVAIEYSASMRRQRRFPQVTRVASLTDSRLLQQFRAAADRDSTVRDEWLQRFETAMRALPDRQRLDSALPRLLSFQRPENPLRAEALGSTERFHAAVQEAKIGPDKDVPHITASSS